MILYSVLDLSEAFTVSLLESLFYLFIHGLEISFSCYESELVSSFKSLLCLLLQLKVFSD